MPRVPYPDLSAPGDELAAVLDDIGRGRSFVPNLYRMLLWSPPLTRRWVALANEVRLGGELSDRDRELAILVVARVTGCEYEWHHHSRLATAAGVSDAEVAALARWPEPNGWSLRDRFLLEVAGAVAERRRASAEAVSALREELGEPGVVALVVTAAYYVAVAHFLLAMDIELEDDT